jgi:hypothetical protein
VVDVDEDTDIDLDMLGDGEVEDIKITDEDVGNLLVMLIDVAGRVGIRVVVVGLFPRQTPLSPQVCPGLHTPQRLPIVQRVPGLSAHRVAMVTVSMAVG